MEAILKALQNIERPGTFATSGVVEPCLLGLEITGVGSIGLPISENQAQAIIKQCYQAPYGRGEATILDTSVRRTWQLEPQNLHIHNPQWQIIMSDLVKRVTQQLGLGNSSVSYHLYKLLMYETGDFFTTHRDTEKVDNMFATLLIALPCEHEGGELLVRHHRQEELIYFGGENKHYQLQYAAFYADCEHEVKPISRGYRCCLVYNLALENTSQQPLAPNNSIHAEQLSKLIKTWFEQESSDKMAILLEHQYTKAGLAFDNLKNADRMKVDVLLAAAKQANCEAYLAMITRWESGEAEDYYDSYDDDGEMGEIYDWSLSVDHWIAADGQEKLFGEMDIDEDNIIAEFNLIDRDPDQQEVHEATGNEGVSMERWYHQAALVIWPQHRHFYQLCQAGQHHAIPQLSEMVRNVVILDPATHSQQWLQCQQFATEIIQEWQIPHHYVHTEDYADSQAMLDLLIKIGKVELLQQFMRTVLTRILSGKEGEAIITVGKQHGWLSFQQELGLMAEQQPKNIWAYIQLFEQLCTFEKQQDTERLTLCQTLAPKVLTTLQHHDANSRQFSGFTKTPEHPVRSLESLFKSLYYIDETRILTEVVAHFTTANYSLQRCLIPAVKNLATWFTSQNHSCTPFQQLLQYCIGELKTRTAVPVIMPQNWTQDITLSCTCSDCQELQQFLKHPTEQIHRFRVKKERRQHLHQQIDKHHCDMTHETERKGSPQTLVCTKNRSSYEKRQKQWEIDNELLGELQGIAPLPSS